MTNEPIEVWAITDPQTPSSLLKRVEMIASTQHGKPSVIVFSEGVFGQHAITRQEGKMIAYQLRSIAQRHGQLVIGYSVIEKNKNGIINLGYLIQPNHPVGYQVYNKASTYFRGKELTDYDNHNVRLNKGNVMNSAQRTLRRVQKMKDFPTAILAGKTIRLQVCADSARPETYHQRGKDPLPKKLVKKKADLLLVPASELEIDHDGIREQLNPSGSAIVTDQKYRETTHIRPDSHRVVQHREAFFELFKPIKNRTAKKSPIHSRRTI